MHNLSQLFNNEHTGSKVGTTFKQNQKSNKGQNNKRPRSHNSLRPWTKVKVKLMKMRVRPSDLWAKPRLKTRWFETKTTQWYYLTLLVGGILSYIRVHYLISLNLNIEWCVVNIDSLT